MLTDKLIQVCDLVGIPILDHIIVGGDNSKYFSFKEKDILSNPYVYLKKDYNDLEFNIRLVAEEKSR